MSERTAILLVDDEPDILVALEDLFDREYQVLAASSGAAGLALLAEHPEIDVIISDQRMPEMTGDVFLEKARELSAAAAILLTGYADLSAVVAALNQGGIVGYSPKPWEPGGLRAMVAGAAERIRLRRALAREQALLQGLMDHIPAEVAFKDAEGRYVQVNRRKAEALGGDLAKVIGRTEADVTARQPRESEGEALRTGRPTVSTTELATPTGPKWLETEAVPILGVSGAPSHLAVISRDVTAQKLSEIQLRQSDKLRALGTLAGGVAHDFNNLLAAVLGSLELAGRRMGDEVQVRKYLDNAVAAAQRGAALTQRLLGFSRQSDHRAALTDMPSVLNGAHELVARTLGPTVQVAWNIAPGLWPCMLEADQLELALLNLGVNARDAMEGRGTVGIVAANVTVAAGERPGLTAGDYVRITVEDSGHGMTPETMARVMEPFFTTKPPGKGTGLGLPMVYGFAQRSGGGVEIDSAVGEGTRINLFLPRSPMGAPASLEDALASVRVGDRKLCVLVVDDEAIVRGVTADFLRDLGHEVLEAPDGASALQMFSARPDKVDLAVVDFAMPGMNGVDLAVAARARKPDLPVILLTGYFDLQAVPTDISIMHKPFTDKGLLEAISAALEARNE